MYIILGCGSVGASVAELLSDKDLLIIDKDPKRVESLRERGFDASVNDCTKINPKKLGLTNKDTILILTPVIETNLKALRRIRKSLPRANIIVRALGMVSAKKLKKAKASFVTQSDVIAHSIVKELETFEEKRDVNRLVDQIKETKNGAIGVFLHTNPDPDALASSLALKKICDEEKVKCKLYYSGEIRRRENKAFVNLFELELERLDPKQDLLALINKLEKTVLLDSPRPGANNVFPKDVIPNIIIDHHPVEEKLSADFTDIRKIGASSTILTKYLQQLDINIEEKLAAALLYGIKSDTKGFTRGTTPEDLNAVAYLSPLADKEALSKVEAPPMDLETLEVMGKAIQNKEVHGTYLISCVNTIKDRDALAQAAEFLLSLEGITTVLVFGIVNDEIAISSRTDDVRINLGEVLSNAFGAKSVKAALASNEFAYPSAGGHAKAAGAQIPLGLLGGTSNKQKLVDLAKSAVKKRFFESIGVEEERGEE